MVHNDNTLRSLLNWNEDEILASENNLMFLKSLSTKTFQDVFSAYLSKLPTFGHSVDNTIIRGRLNETNDDFFKVSQLSYNTESVKRIKSGRFNRDEQPMFYGTIPNGNKVSNPGVTSCLESLPDIVSGEGIHGHKDFTVGIWKVISPFDVFDLTIDRNENNPFKSQIVELIKQVELCSQGRVTKIVFDFWAYVSELCSNKSTSPFDYVLSNTLLESVKSFCYRNGKKLNGLLYPSSRTDRLGTNIVLYPEVVDQYLSLESVLVYRIVRRAKEDAYDMFPLCEPVKVVGKEFTIKRFSKEQIAAISSDVA